MSLWENWVNGFLGRRSQPDDEPVRAVLDAQQSNIASRLSKLTGKDRDEVLAETYRQADQIMTGQRKR